MEKRLIAPAEEVALKNMLKKGDIDTIARIFEAYYSMLLSYACKFVPRTTAEDIIQDIFVELQKKCSSLEIRLTLKAYLFRAVHNKCVDHLRCSIVHKRYANQALMELSLRESGYFDPQKGNVSLLMGDNLLAVSHAIAQLPPRCQEILKLKYQDELGNKEIAQLLHLSVRTVETQLYKAIKKIRGKVRKLSYLFLVLIYNMLSFLFEV